MKQDRWYLGNTEAAPQTEKFPLSSVAGFSQQRYKISSKFEVQKWVCPIQQIIHCQPEIQM